MKKNNITALLISFISIIIFISACDLSESPPAYTVTYNGNCHSGGTIPVDTGEYEAGETVTVKGKTGDLVCLGYFFAGWNTQANGEGLLLLQYPAWKAGMFRMSLIWGICSVV